jgi:hypothetical protein
MVAGVIIKMGVLVILEKFRSISEAITRRRVDGAV